MTTEQSSYGMSDEQLRTEPTVYGETAFAGQTWLISGGGSGIGKATAWLAGRLGARIILAGRSEEKLKAAAAPMREAGITVDARPVNIRDHEQVVALFDYVASAYTTIDVLVNSAGGQFPQEAIDFSPNGWKAVIDTNLNGTWYMMQTAAKLWRDSQTPGNIVNLVTVNDRGMPGLAHTCAARAGVIHMSRSVAVEWAPYNIRINCIAPGIIATEGMDVYPESARAHFTKSNPMRRFASAWDVAELCAYLGSKASNFITGETITIDGGGKLWGELWPAGKPEYFETT